MLGSSDFNMSSIFISTVKPTFFSLTSAVFLAPSVSSLHREALRSASAEQTKQLQSLGKSSAELSEARRGASRARRAAGWGSRIPWDPKWGINWKVHHRPAWNFNTKFWSIILRMMNLAFGLPHFPLQRNMGTILYIEG